ncbi:Transposable element Tcb2 transposase [Cucumispora dikerogammari]|nr:Transposable element Tcb2 transposase [Cucumispora dikerogammari]
MKENSLTGKNKAIIELYDEQITIREIARLLKVPKSTVSRVIIKHREYGSIGRKIGSGRPKLVSTREIAEIRSIRSAEPKISATKLAAKLNEVCNYKGTVQTVRNSLVSLGISAYSPCMKPLLSDKNIALRYSLAQRWSYLPEAYWNNVIFSDECKFNLFTSDGKGYIWREKGARLDPKYLSPTIKFGGGNIMVWGCISSKGMGKLVFIEEIMDRYLYTSILANNLKSSAELMGLDTFIFQQDNDPKHTSVHTKAFFIENNIEVLAWPSQSPDMNPIEHAWAYMKYKLRDQNIKNKNELKEKLTELWNNFPEQILSNIIKSMKNRILSVLRASGKHTDY